MPSDRSTPGRSSRRKRWRSLLAFFLFAGLAGDVLFQLQPAVAAADSSHSMENGPEVSEFQVKAAFLYNFAKFIEWPPDAFSGDRETFRICTMGATAVRPALEEVVHGRDIGGRPLQVIHVSALGDACNCHILFLSAAEIRRNKNALGAYRPRGVLTVGETEGFASWGGMINFVPQSGRIRLEINPPVAESAGLHISSKLLSLARIVR